MFKVLKQTITLNKVTGIEKQMRVKQYDYHPLFNNFFNTIQVKITVIPMSKINNTDDVRNLNGYVLEVHEASFMNESVYKAYSQFPFVELKVGAEFCHLNDIEIAWTEPLKQNEKLIISKIKQSFFRNVQHTCVKVKKITV